MSDGLCRECGYGVGEGHAVRCSFGPSPDASPTGGGSTSRCEDVRLFARPDTEREAMLQAALGLARAELARNRRTESLDARTIEACARVCERLAQASGFNTEGNAALECADAIRALSPLQIDGEAK